MICVKRFTAYIFLVSVNLILLAHAVFPHHHHNLQAYLFEEHCVDDSVAHNHDAGNQKHEHGENENLLDCLLYKGVTIPSNNFRCDGHNSISSIGNYDFHPILLNSNIFIQDNLALPSNSPPDINTSLFFVYVSQCFGLRAPPLI
jgi:hypothetical protein